uniref:Uncharacterized protein n=1 Tax=Megaselia scalaris TaxID=36166 RepID=T1H3D4_MEGSC
MIFGAICIKDHQHSLHPGKSSAELLKAVGCLQSAANQNLECRNDAKRMESFAQSKKGAKENGNK